jgi:7,8-dihydroneopterin aldolase/epimerase/oxygenase
MNYLTIELHNLRFFAHHGMYEEEKKVANEFNVDIKVSFEAERTITSINDSINYVKLYELVKKHMLQEQRLLETIAMNITNDIHEQYAQVKKISVTITKKYPPVINFSGNVAVSYVREF